MNPAHDALVELLAVREMRAEYVRQKGRRPICFAKRKFWPASFLKFEAELREREKQAWKDAERTVQDFLP